MTVYKGILFDFTGFEMMEYSFIHNEIFMKK